MPRPKVAGKMALKQPIGGPPMERPAVAPVDNLHPGPILAGHDNYFDRASLPASTPPLLLPQKTLNRITTRQIPINTRTKTNHAPINPMQRLKRTVRCIVIATVLAMERHLPPPVHIV